ncbi:HAD-IA family hydrolase [bacterium]|nr:HAD-IA family hydrolase [bacterium]
MSELNFDAVIFDMDGVVTDTAILHSESWRVMFNNYLRSREVEFGEQFIEFTHKGDYLPIVDGKPRYKGVEAFLESRKIKLPFGDSKDCLKDLTICGLGNEKNRLFGEMLNEGDVKIFESSIFLIEALRKKGVRIGLASSSKNSEAVLKAADIKYLFETIVDGIVSAREGLNGKPAPDIFTFAADNLGVAYEKSVVVEDAASGVKAGKAGNFGFVIGIAREDNENTLKGNGADLVVNDLEEVDISVIENWFRDKN